MKTIVADPLLGIAKLILHILLGIICIAAVGAAIGLLAMLLYPTGLLDGFVDFPMETGQALLGAGMIATVLGLLALLLTFLRHMLAIARSVELGDPFVPANAKRLSSMAWITLAANLLAIPLAVLVVQFFTAIGETPEQGDVGLDLGGILMVLVLFILARVFRKGTEMREDLEGTV